MGKGLGEGRQHRGPLCRLSEQHQWRVGQQEPFAEVRSSWGSKWLRAPGWQGGKAILLAGVHEEPVAHG